MNVKHFRTWVAIAITALTASLLTGPVPAAAAQQPDPVTARVIDLQERLTPALLQIEGVVGTAVCLHPGGRPAVVIFLAEPDLARHVPPFLENVPIVVHVTGEIVAVQDVKHHNPGHGRGGGGGGGGENPYRHARPVPIGVSTRATRASAPRGPSACASSAGTTSMR